MQDGAELFPLPDAVHAAGFPLARTFKGADFAALEALEALNWANNEGFVVRFADGGRCKVKFANYKLAHAASDQLTVRSLWAAFEGGCSLAEVMSSLTTDEYGPWVQRKWGEFEREPAERLTDVVATHRHARISFLETAAGCGPAQIEHHRLN